MARIAFHHHGCGLEDGHSDLRYGQLLVVGLLRRDDWGIGGQHEVDAGIWHQVGLELRDVHIQCAVEPQRGRQTGDDLGNEAVQVGVCRALNVEVPAREESSLSNCMQDTTVIRQKRQSALSQKLACMVPGSCGRCHRALHCHT